MLEVILFVQSMLLLTVLYVVTNKKPRTRRQHALVLDTSALIDGRIVEIANAGFITQQLVVPKFIVAELQLLADGNDSHKRERARFGLDMVQVLQNTPNLNVAISGNNVPGVNATDDKLVALAKKMSANLCTTDYNLNKVAKIEGIQVLNVNELSNALRPVALPGEQKQVKIVQKGSSKSQGVGYLEDGSMVVVEDAARFVGRQVTVQISRYIQTDAGKMLFGRKVNASHPRKNTR